MWLVEMISAVQMQYCSPMVYLTHPENHPVRLRKLPLYSSTKILRTILMHAHATEQL